MISISILLKSGLSLHLQSQPLPEFSNSSCMNVSKTLLQEYALQDQELEEAFNSLKPNKSPGFDYISSSVVPVVFLIHSSIFLIFHCKLEFFHME